MSAVRVVTTVTDYVRLRYRVDVFCDGIRIEEFTDIIPGMVTKARNKAFERWAGEGHAVQACAIPEIPTHRRISLRR